MSSSRWNTIRKPSQSGGIEMTRMIAGAAQRQTASAAGVEPSPRKVANAARIWYVFLMVFSIFGIM